jgi:cell division protease FtsH
LIAEAHERAHKILEAQRPLLDKLAHLLLERETVEGDELRAMMQATH